MSVQQYDEIGEAFEGFKSLPLTQYGEVPSFLNMVGDVRGKSVLDLACGTGFYSREFRRRGATEVLGVDISGEMVAAALKLEERDPLGVRYEVGDVAELRPLERRFDIALGVQLLNYAQSIAELESMCRNVHRGLVPGGEFFVLAQSPTTAAASRPWPSTAFSASRPARRSRPGRASGSRRCSTRRSRSSAPCRAANSTKRLCGPPDSAT